MDVPTAARKDEGTGTLTVPLPMSSHRYRLLAELGRGGMATAYLADMAGPNGFHKLVVVKRLRAGFAAESDYLKMFIEEAKLGARIDHPNVVHTTEVAQDGENFFIALEYIQGQTFESMLRASSRGPDGGFVKSRLPLGIQLHVLREVLSGLHYAHELSDYDGTPLRLVHRDVSPHNVMVSYEGHVKLLDFGIAKVTTGEGNTGTGIIKGKVAYMPLEQFLGSKTIDRRADVFAVGAMLWHALAGKRLWSGVDDAEIFRKLHMNEVPSPRTIEPDVDADLEAICMKALARDPGDRYATAADMLAALETYAKEKNLLISPREVGAWLSTEFEESRKKIQAVIEAQLGKPEETEPIKVPVESLPDIWDPQTSNVESVLEPAHSTGANMAATLPLDAKRGRPRVARIVGVATILAVGAVAVLQLRRTPPPAPTPTNIATEATTTRVIVRSNPASARVLLDGKLLDGVPPTIDLPRDGASHALRIEASGYRTYEDTVVASERHVVITAALETAAPATESNSPPPQTSSVAQVPARHVTTSPRNRTAKLVPEAPTTPAEPTPPAPPEPSNTIDETATTTAPITRGKLETDNPFKD